MSEGTGQPKGTIALDWQGIAWQKKKKSAPVWRSVDGFSAMDNTIQRWFEEGYMKYVHIPELSPKEKLPELIASHYEDFRDTTMSPEDFASDIMLLVKEAEDAG